MVIVRFQIDRDISPYKGTALKAMLARGSSPAKCMSFPILGSQTYRVGTFLLFVQATMYGIVPQTNLLHSYVGLPLVICCITPESSICCLTLVLKISHVVLCLLSKL